MTQKKTLNKNGSAARLGFEEKLWAAADKMRSYMDPAEYKHVVLGLIFLKYVSDSFQERYEALKAEEYADPEDRDEYLAENVFWVPQEARWDRLQADAKRPEIGRLIDDAMGAIERENPSLKGVLPKDYSRPSLDKQRLGELMDLTGTIGLGDEVSRKSDVLGRVYEYFLGRFASAEGKGGGEFYTPRSVVGLLVEMIEPYKGRVYDPCCGSGGMFVMSEKFVEAHGGRVGDIAIYSQESNPTTWRLCKMNLAIRGINGDLGSQPPTPCTTTCTRTSRPTTSSPTHRSTSRTGAARGFATTCAGSTAHRRWATPITPGCSTSFTTSPRGVWRASCSPTARSPRTRAGKEKYGGRSSRPTSWTASSPCPRSCSTPPKSPSASGSSHATRATGAFETEAARRSLVLQRHFCCGRRSVSEP